MISYFPNVHGSGIIYMDVLRALCGDTTNKTMIDLMSNKAPYTSQLGFKERTYMDILPRKLDNPNEQQFFIQQDVFDIDFINGKMYNVSICSDGIEHLTKENGKRLLYIMNLISVKQILFTPLGDYMVDTQSTDPEGHHSGWLPKDVPEYDCLVFPEWHPTLNIGSFFFFKLGVLNHEEEFKRIVNELKQKKWN